MSGEIVARGGRSPAVDRLVQLAARLPRAVIAASESIGRTRFVCDRLELHGSDVRVADAVKAKGLAPPACKRDKIERT